MKLIFTGVALLLGVTSWAQDSTSYQIEATTSVANLQTSDQQVGGVQVRQQLTYLVTPHVGIALGFGWGQQNVAGPTNLNDLAGLARIFHREIGHADLSLIVRPFVTRRHLLSLSAGIANLRQVTTRADSVYLNSTRPTDFDPVRVRVVRTEQRSVTPVVGASYLFRITPRLAVGAEGRLTWAQTGQRISTIGLVGSYQFNVSGASLGFPQLAPDELTWGVRVGVNFSGPYERGNSAFRLAPRPMAGVWTELPLGINWQLRSELSYVGRGYDRFLAGKGSAIDGVDRSQYIDASLLFSTEITSNWRVLLGPNLGFLLTGQFVTGNQVYPTRPGLNSGLVVGTSVALGKRISLDARYVRDVVQFSRNPYNGYQGFQFSTSLRLGK